DFFGGNDNANAVLIQPDGKIVAAGWGLDPSLRAGLGFGVVRYNSDGSLDPTFGSGGKVVTTAAGTPSQGLAAALQADQKIVVAGLTEDLANCAVSFGLARYNSNGSVDVTFGTGGYVTTSFGTVDDEAFAVAIQADQKIVAAGYATTDTGAPIFA